MIDRKEMMKHKRKNVSVHLIKLLKRIDNYDSDLVCVFENQDAEYYGSRIDMYVNNLNRKNLECKGKDYVLEVKRKVDENDELKKANILYFIDSDFDYIIGLDEDIKEVIDNNVYTTPCHSIENLYVSEYSFTKIITDRFHINELDNPDLFESIINTFRVFESRADDCLKDLNAWLVVVIEDSNIDNSIILNINNYSINNFLSFDGYTINKVYEIKDLKDIFKIDYDIDELRYNNYLEKLSKNSLSKVSRGKYRLEYYREFLLQLIKDAVNGCSIFQNNKNKISLQLSKNPVSELSVFAETPQCLKNFLINFAQENANKVA